MSAVVGSSTQSGPSNGDGDVKTESIARDPSLESGEPRPKVRKRRLGVDPTLIISEERSKRRRTPSPEAEEDSKAAVFDPKDPVRAKLLGMQIYRKIMDSTDTE